MRLLVDIGNTRIKWAWSERSGELSGCASAFGVDALCASVENHARPQAVLLADVRGDVGLQERIVQALAALGWPECMPVASRARFGPLRIGYADATQLGVDRFLALVAASEFLPQPVIVLNAGTALTVDALDANGRHLGGVIMPGLRSIAGALGAAAPRLPAVREFESVRLEPWGTDTASAIGNGILYAWAGAAGRVVDDMRERLGADCRVLIGGGDGALLGGRLKTAVHHDEFLVLRGMTYL